MNRKWKLTPEQVREIRRTRHTRRPGRPDGFEGSREGRIKTLAQRYGVSDPVIVRVAKGYSYKHVR